MWWHFQCKCLFLNRSNTSPPTFMWQECLSKINFYDHGNHTIRSFRTWWLDINVWRWSSLVQCYHAFFRTVILISSTSTSHMESDMVRKFWKNAISIPRSTSELLGHSSIFLNSMDYIMLHHLIWFHPLNFNGICHIDWVWSNMFSLNAKCHHQLQQCMISFNLT